MITSFTTLKKQVKKKPSNLKKIKVAILAESASQHFSVALNGMGVNYGFDFEIYESDYDQVELQINNYESELYHFNPDFLIIFPSVQKLYTKFLKLNEESRNAFYKQYELHTKELINTFQTKLKSKIVWLNYPEYNDGIFGNYSNKLSHSWIYQLRRINLELMHLAQVEKNLFISDIALLNINVGYQNTFDPKLYVYGDIIFSLDFLPVVAKNICDIISALSGKFKKALILDLDNTTWGGIIGDDGIENIQVGDLGIGKAFSNLQKWAKELKNRGVILAICSKNTEEIAKEPFISHPEMVLKLDDIAVFVANWENKVDNIKFIQSVLNIGFDSMVFLDDNAFERNIVRENIPEITVPELPVDPADYYSFLTSLNLFETASYSVADADRTKQYQVESERVVLQKSFNSEADYLVDLNMQAQVSEFNKFNAPRISQLSQRSNQFNLRTIRYTEQDILNISNDENYIGLAISLEDKFGDYGLICVLVLKKVDQNLFIETWLMSCRVLKRTVERFTLNYIIDLAKSNKISKIIGEYIPTPKNEIVKDHYKNLGFINEDGKWTLDVNQFHTQDFYISLKEK